MRRRRVASDVLRLGLLLAAAPARLAAQEAEPAPRWSASLHYDAQRIAPAPDEAYWQMLTASVGRTLAHGSIALQAASHRRFGATEQALAVDAYPELWSGAYGNVRVAAAPGAETLARWDVGAELFQALGSSELSTSVRRQGFERAEVTSLGMGAARYAGNWYLRARTVAAHVDRSWSPFVVLTGRRYLGDGVDDSLDLTVGLGEEVLEVAADAGAGVDVATSASRFAGVRTQRYLGRHVGVTAGASYSAYDAIADRWGVSIGLLTRW